jgi:hypothetical protein
MTDNEIIYTIWGIGPIRKQFDIAPYSLKPDEIKTLQHLDYLKSPVNTNRLMASSIECG